METQTKLRVMNTQIQNDRCGINNSLSGVETRCFASRRSVHPLGAQRDVAYHVFTRNTDYSVETRRATSPQTSPQTRLYSLEESKKSSKSKESQFRQSKKSQFRQLNPTAYET
jgi:hypothetical protein